MKEIDFTSFKLGKQLVNKIPNLGRIFTNRLNLMYTIKNNANQLMGKFNLYVKDFFPECYNLDILNDLKQFLESPS